MLTAPFIVNKLTKKNKNKINLNNNNNKERKKNILNKIFFWLNYLLLPISTLFSQKIKYAMSNLGKNWINFF